MSQKTQNKNDRNIESDQLLELLDELNVGAFTVNIHRKVSSMNLTAQALMGLKEDEAENQDCREVFCGVPCMIKCLFKSGKAWDDDPTTKVTEAPHRLVTRLATPIYDSKQELVGCLTILQDHYPITDLINRVHFEERSLKMILENLDIGIFTVNRGGHITFFNNTAETISGYARNQVLGKPCATLFEGAGKIDLEMLKDSIENGNTRSNRNGRMRTNNGDIIPIRASFMALKNEKGYIVGGLSTFYDLTVVYQLNKAISDRYTFHDMIGKDPSMQKIFDITRVVSGTNSTVLIEGPTGTGKDLLAKIIHSESTRAGKPFVKVNCAALPENLLESEMFGYVKGAFTGADRDKPGRFQEASGGTILLDEIGDLPLSLQAKMLHVLEDKKFYPLGSRRPVKVDIRILSASNRGLKNLVDKHQFREDLYYRLNVLQIEIPPLKDRRSDIPLLIRHIMRKHFGPSMHLTKDISEKAMEVLLNYNYPGNIRELENILEHALIISQEERIELHHLPNYILKDFKSSCTNFDENQDHKKPATANKERETILKALQNNKWNRTQAANALKMERTTLWRKMKRYNIIKQLPE
ncbi:MAG: sigma 54-interacting transcriptional regulator [Proteobacteria bacterium]|nr:sigma 54-interacting transcriptional regulator [Pseudomonadota bacterium]